MKKASFDRHQALTVMLSAARQASTAIKKVYATPDFDVEMKGKNDPVTRADKEANALVIKTLAKVYKDIPVVAEESDPETYEGHQNAERVFFVDPLDGTREFVARNGEFCVMVGLAEEGKATLGVVVSPVDDRAFIGGLFGIGAWEVDASGERTAVKVGRTTALKAATCIISRSHRNEETDAILQRLGVKKLVPFGSAGLKALKIATGEVDLYCHPGPSGCRWDSCAVEAIISGAGGLLTNAKGKRYDYRAKSLKNTAGVLAGNPELHEKALAKLLSFN